MFSLSIDVAPVINSYKETEVMYSWVSFDIDASVVLSLSLVLRYSINMLVSTTILQFSNF